MLGGVLANILGDFHRAEVRTAHGTKMCGLGAFLGKRLTKLMPMIFALAGLPVYVASSQSAPFIMVWNRFLLQRVGIPWPFLAVLVRSLHFLQFPVALHIF